MKTEPNTGWVQVEVIGRDNGYNGQACRARVLTGTWRGKVVLLRGDFSVVPLIENGGLTAEFIECSNIVAEITEG